MNTIKWKPFLISIAVSLGVGALAGILTSGSMEQYERMYQPPLSPPGWVFPIVWTILFLLMGIASYLVATSDSNPQQIKTALSKYALQLAANFLWSLIFFNLDAYLLAFAWLILLWYLIFLTWKAFKEIDKTAGYLLIPYLTWVTFAAYLNLAIVLYYL